MSNTYLFALTDGGGTVAPEVGVARRLVERGHRVAVLAEDSMGPAVTASGAAFRPWRHGLNRPSHRPEHAPYREWELGSPPALVREMINHLVVRPASGYARDVTEAIHADRPGLVLVSFFAFGAMVAAEAEGVPFDVLMPNIYPLPAPGLPPFGPGLRPARGPAGRLRDRLVGAVSQRMWDRSTLPGLNAVRAAHGLAPVTHYQDQVHRARRELVMTSAEFDFPARLPAGVRYVGPVLDEPVWAAGPWQPPAGDAPLVLVSMSSTFQDQADCLRRVADALGSLSLRGLVTTGPVIDPGRLTPPPGVTVVPAAPHGEVLRHASLVVTHGGHGTLVKAFAAGVPVVVLPHGRDQADNAARVVQHGAGLSVSRAAKPAKIAAAVRQVLDDPAYRRSAARLGAALRRDAGDGRLMAEVEDIDPGQRQGTAAARATDGRRVPA
ncbi:glycosyltransferase [Frankia sp. CNm7]|uniref:Glycosyltransferase n=1 Tax=Frankia nepalensis TaxID=1836974 RepID=A0A937URY6_9ACTN|nr:nucleotide disphospho-sugar-binding domain-containing protein [Frankia nepalensis]MBL7498808.1 glycosyltransferase [Frankia nepalensis]MBL7508613.1 glycosyltransferase [Frankia nepalensis]MBL7517469.1 glycosyltransferase [Frankia nepalensis]MBL7629715.1 glycosyltransferase [Frankia nepalensis]